MSDDDASSNENEDNITDTENVTLSPNEIEPSISPIDPGPSSSTRTSIPKPSKVPVPQKRSSKANDAQGTSQPSKGTKNDVKEKPVKVKKDAKQVKLRELVKVLAPTGSRIEKK